MVGDFLGKHFVASYQQAGDFKVVNVGGKIQRNGGNVASYFCSAEGRVIHAVGKNVSGNRLLREARWALKTFQNAQADAPGNLNRQAQLIELAHLAELQVDRPAFLAKANQEFPAAMKTYLDKQKSTMASYGRRGAGRSVFDRLDPPLVEARLRAARHFSGDRAHQMLAAQPLPLFTHVAKRMFESLSGERFTGNRSRVYLAAEGLRRARDRNQPVLLVLYRGKGPDREQYDDATKKLFSEVLSQPVLVAPLRSSTVVAIPLKQLPALTSLAALPSYQTPQDASPLVIVTRPTGEQVTALTGSIAPDRLSSWLWRAWADARLQRAELLTQEDKHAAALRLMKEALKKTSRPTRRQEILSQIDQANLKLSEQWADEGKTRLALRLLSRVQAVTKDDRLRERARQRVVELRSTL